MLNFKLFAVLVIASSSCNYFILASEADWEVLNAALDNINASNPIELKNSILNILSEYLPQDMGTIRPPAIITSSTTPSPVSSTSSVSPPAHPHPSITSWQQLYALYPHLFHPQFHTIPHHPTRPTHPLTHPIITQIHPESHEKCECRKKKHKSLAEFLVNVPCPTTTEKPMRKIVVKVPCPTTTTTEKPECACQCCPCNPCDPPHNKKNHKFNHRKPISNEESDEIFYETYQVNRNDIKRSRPFTAILDED